MFPAPFHDSAHSPDGSSSASKLGMAEVKQGPQEVHAKLARATFGKVFDENIQSSAMDPRLAAQRLALPAIGFEADDPKATTLSHVSDASEPSEQEMELFGAPMAMRNPVSIPVDATSETEGRSTEHLVTGATPNLASQSPPVFTDIEAAGEPEGDMTAGWPHDFPDRPGTVPTALGQPILTDPAGEATARHEGQTSAQDTNRKGVQGPVDITTLTATGYREMVGEPDGPLQFGPTKEPTLAESVWCRSRTQIPIETVAFDAVETDSAAPIEGWPSRPGDALVLPRANEHSQPKVSGVSTEPLQVGKAAPSDPTVPLAATLSPEGVEQDNEPGLGSDSVSFRRSNEWSIEGRHQSPTDATGTSGSHGPRQGALMATKTNIVPNLGLRAEPVDAGQTAPRVRARVPEEARPTSSPAGSTVLPTLLASSPPPSVNSVAMGAMSLNPIATPPLQLPPEAAGADPVVEVVSGRTTFIPDGATEAKARIAYAIEFQGPGTGKREMPRDSLDGLLGHDSGTMFEPLPHRRQIWPVTPQKSTALLASHTHAQSVVAQIATAAETSKTGRAEVKLDPEELGKVTLNLITSDRAITVLIATERAETLDLMRRNIEMLGQEFRQMGYQDVSFAFREQGGQSREWDGAPDPIDDASEELALNDSPTASLQVSDGHLDIRL
ncbi:MAG: flagellar hook-length control protein FliK [Flavimaricola sp.]|nr:flagellar hook-length control protein FliK [Flavimaricola sp.]